MKIFLIALLLIASATAFPSFEEYVAKFDKVYNDLEYEQRREIYEYHISTLAKHSEDNYQVGVNKFSDMTAQEKSMFLGYIPSRGLKPLPQATRVSKENFADSIDWSAKGATTPVKDQGQCGSCWAFASTEGVESAWYLATGELLELAPQQFVDCVENPRECGGTGGCEGATVDIAYQYLEQAGGLALEKDYPYQAKDGTCNTGVRKAANITKFYTAKENEYDSVMAALQNGPLAVAVDASAWFSYTSGIFDGCNQAQPDINHGVQLVGYGEENGKAYWKIRNSWGSSWAEGGYIRLLRHTSNTPCGEDITPLDGLACNGDDTPVNVCGTCGVLYNAIQPIVEKLNK